MDTYPWDSYINAVALYKWIMDSAAEKRNILIPVLKQKEETRISPVHSTNRGERVQDAERPAAHFEADSITEGSLNWTTGGDNSFSQGGLVLTDNKLYIQRTGLYFLYTQATFGGDHCPPERENLLSHSLILHSKEHGEPMQLLDAQKTACGEQPRPTSASRQPGAKWRKTIFQGAAFKLNKGDFLYTVTKGSDYLRTDMGANYFGIYAL
ncbi:tumor necrosis factor-like [Pseudophryne corroboree]|uniref:tumor necrosis factor-like n=1 Tax=Pseudophryne corroboree TaxID=495146 RepID=UPI0030813F4B